MKQRYCLPGDSATFRTFTEIPRSTDVHPIMPPSSLVLHHNNGAFLRQGYSLHAFLMHHCPTTSLMGQLATGRRDQAHVAPTEGRSRIAVVCGPRGGHPPRARLALISTSPTFRRVSRDLGGPVEGPRWAPERYSSSSFCRILSGKASASSARPEDGESEGRSITTKTLRGANKMEDRELHVLAADQSCPSCQDFYWRLIQKGRKVFPRSHGDSGLNR